MNKILFFSFFLSWSANAIAQKSFQKAPNSLTPADKVFGLSRFWQEVNYNFVYLEKVDRKAWDKRFKELISIVENTKNDYEYYRELQKLCAFLKDGHTNVFLPNSIPTMIHEFGKYQIYLLNMEGKAIVARVSASGKEEIPIGSEIIEVNGMSTEEYLEHYVVPYLSSSTEYVLKDMAIELMFQGLAGDQYQIKIKKPDNKEAAFTLVHEAIVEKELFPPEEKRQLLDFKWLDGQMAYVALNSFEDPKIVSLFVGLLPELRKAKALVLDLRNNGGGNSDYAGAVLQYLTRDSILYGAKSRTRQHIATYKAWGGFVRDASDTIGSPAIVKDAYLSKIDRFYFDLPGNVFTCDSGKQPLIIPTAILIGHNTASASEDFLIYADKQKHFITIGSNTFGSTGQPYMFDLPGGGSAWVCTKQDTYPDGREFVGYGIAPDIKAGVTLTDYLNKRDTVLYKAIDCLIQKLE